MPVSFQYITVGGLYSRTSLAVLWGYASLHAIARGVVTPKDDNQIILFVSGERKGHSEQYENKLEGDKLLWDGPNDHFAEQRMLNVSKTGDTIHLFYRAMHRSDFIYMGTVSVESFMLHTDKPSNFVLRITKH